jgi:hypothetical protein
MSKKPHWYRDELHDFDAMMKRQALRLARKLNRKLPPRKAKSRDTSPLDFVPGFPVPEMIEATDDEMLERFAIPLPNEKKVK